MATKEQTEVCTIKDLGFEITGTDAPPMIEAINDYLSAFAKPLRGEKDGNMFVGSFLCLKCKTPLGGVLGSFKWGMVNGEGNCNNCGWPCRAIHRIKDDAGPIFSQAVERILQYHPDCVTPRKEASGG